MLGMRALLSVGKGQVRVRANVCYGLLQMVAHTMRAQKAKSKAARAQLPPCVLQRAQEMGMSQRTKNIHTRKSQTILQATTLYA